VLSDLFCLSVIQGRERDFLGLTLSNPCLWERERESSALESLSVHPSNPTLLSNSGGEGEKKNSSPILNSDRERERQKHSQVMSLIDSVFLLSFFSERDRALMSLLTRLHTHTQGEREGERELSSTFICSSCGGRERE